MPTPPLRAQAIHVHGNGSNAQAPLDAEIFGIDRLEEYAKELAHAHRTALTRRSQYSLLKRLTDNERLLRTAQAAFAEEARSGQTSLPAADWLLDNYYLVQEQIREIRQNLTRGYYAELVKLSAGPYAGYPRIYSLAVEVIAHTDSRLHNDVLVRFIQAYQSAAPLSSGELWAFAIMLRVGLIENLRRLIGESLAVFEQRRRADRWADRILALRNRPKTEIFGVLAELEEQQSDLPDALLLQLLERLRDQDPAIAPAIRWLEQRLATLDVDLETLVRNENQHRAKMRVSVGNVITSLRLLTTLNWQDFFETTSLLERVLRQDPSGIYSHMDFGTRDRYRHSVEYLSKHSPTSEADVAHRAIELARAAHHSENSDARTAHVGYYLIDEGLAQLQAEVNYRPTLYDRTSDWILNHGTAFYLTLIAALNVAFVLGALAFAQNQSATDLQLFLVALFTFLPMSVLATGVMNWTITVQVPPHVLSKLEFKTEIPKEYRTMVVVPALLSSISGIDYLCRHQELRFLANRDECLHFVLLTDFGDAPQQHMAEDQVLLDQIKQNVQTLNEQYSNGKHDRFYLFHRERRWNPVSQTWMGWERKRGKLIEFNRLLRGATDTGYIVQVGDLSILSQVKYVITLDADTELPLNAARRLVGTLAHPLNHAVVDSKTQRVVKGYGIVQPRVEVTAEAAAQSRFARLFTGDAGLDPYSSVVSDVYQDMFHTSIYIGKAIYDVDAMSAAVGTRFPENLLLSHDLLEGVFARTGLASDILLLEDFPSGYDGFTQRQHRWIRGDWQIIDWVFGRSPNPLPVIERWKIFDNLRRSLLPPAIILFFLAGWTILPGSPLVWTGLALGVIVFPLVPGIFSAVGVHPPGEPWRSYFLALAHEFARTAQRAFLLLAMLLYQACQNVDAITKAFSRRLFNSRRLLEWNSAAKVQHGQAQTLGEYWQRMWIAPVLALVLGLGVIFTIPSSIFVALPILLSWAASPLVAYKLSQLVELRTPELPPETNAELKEIARRIWRFYEDFVGPEDHWLPPDNYQSTPRPIVAHRTSPTNISFLLLSTLAALDFEFINADEFLKRIQATLATLEKMERFRGHWFNWYDTLTLRPLYPEYVSTVDSGNLAAGLIAVRQACLEFAERHDENEKQYQAIADQLDAYVQAFDFRFLFNTARGIFSIGYNVATDRLDDSYYDLLASEARLTSFIAIALRQIPERHWFQMSRPLTHAAGRVALLSWGGTMFEYLMPTLLMRDYPHTLLDQTYAAIIERQIQYGKERSVPWGISESGFYSFDFQFNYQYRMFGVPDLGLKRDLGNNLVIAPYATFLALPYAPVLAWQNLKAIEREAQIDSYGFYEALDYTPAHRPPKERVGIVRSFMAHHQGMSLVALDNYLNNNCMRRRFHREPTIAATELLLQERIPQHTPLLETQPEERPAPRSLVETAPPASRAFKTPHSPVPHAALLSNGQYTVMVTNAGGGYSAYRQFQITRWREDVTRDSWGTFCYIKDVASGQVWSTSFHPTLHEPEDYSAMLMTDRVEFRRYDDEIQTQYEIVVSPEDHVEIRVITLRNHSSSSRLLELTSYAEVTLDTPLADMRHPAFSKLFVESEFVSQPSALLFKRRQRAVDQPSIWAMHTIACEEKAGAIEYETDRAQFLGRGRTPINPIALQSHLSNTVGAVLDPIMSLRTRVQIEPGQVKRVAFVTGVGDSRQAVLALCEKFSDLHVVERAIDLAAAHNQILLHQLNITVDDAQLYQRLASRIIYTDGSLRAAASTQTRNAKGLAGLWPYGISGDHPILLVQLDSPEALGLVRQTLLAHAFWRMHNFHVDLVILNDHPTTYAEGLRRQIEDMINTSLSHPWMDKPGGVFLRQSDHMLAEDKILLQTVARVILNGSLGSLADQLTLTRWMKTNWHEAAAERAPVIVPTMANADDMNNRPQKNLTRTQRASAVDPAKQRTTRAKLFDNSVGGFSEDGSEYVITLNADQWTPTPWSNVIANKDFGCLVTDSGLGYTWAANSQQNKLTSWSNDPIADSSGEIIYLRDETTGEFWTPTPLPIRTPSPFTIRHGAGYSIFQHMYDDLAHKLLVFVAKDAPIKIMRLNLRNLSNRTRRFTATFFVEWVLGVMREQTQHFIVTEHDAESNSLFARNSTNDGYSQSVAFATVNQTVYGLTCDRSEFLGRNGTVSQPASIVQPNSLSGNVGAGLDPCGVLQTQIELRVGEEKDIVFLLGQGKDATEARKLIQYYCDSQSVQKEFDQIQAQWDDLLGTIQVRTPDSSMNLMLNRWLLYQALSCRVWARSAFYQSGGAYGFRDQLQDVMALVYAAPQLAREHILRAAAHQFVEGDVQHWWHAPTTKGIRTRISDAHLWLPFVADYYVTTTGDAGILDESIPFLRAPLLQPDQCEMYGEPEPVEPGMLYEHCVRAIDHSLRFGEHGLPLIGTGDWNDGMSGIGDQGRGESVWLGWFLYANLTAFANIANHRGDANRADIYRIQAERLAKALDESGWDGAWYRRAYFDNGIPLGSKSNLECQIDSIAQSWSIISDGASPEKRNLALQSVENFLVRAQDGLILLLTPPFDQFTPNPGYIEGYLPGIRENGGQYTHAALWVVLAHVLQRNGDRAHELFQMINPICHSDTRVKMMQYKVEPYVVAADVYSHPAHLGRGGWTWYTGSAAWMYRIGVESILGLKLRGDSLVIDPCIPHDWSHFELTFRHKQTRYEIVVSNPKNVTNGVYELRLDNSLQKGNTLSLVQDGKTHWVRIVMG
ncbi:MAG: carbohydrate-binding protein [Chloroflexi bacterium]|nr:carbohydrate-binding protein [Chloroflexota bacterium]